MKAIVQDKYGGPEVLALREIDEPQIGPDEVLIRVHAAGVDAGVGHLMTGLPYPVRLGFGLRAPKLRVRGMEVAGRVHALGAKVTGFQVGDSVYGACEGAFADFARARVDQLASKPANLGFEQAAAVAISGCTALQALRDAGKIEAGQKVLIIGAAGGVGSFAVQLAKAFGAHVTGVCSTAKLDVVRSLGADEVVDYTREDFADRREKYDLVLDTAGNRSVSHLRRALTPTGTLVLVGGEGAGDWFGMMKRPLVMLLLNPFVRHRLRPVLGLTRAADLEVLRELIEAGKLTPLIDRTYPLAEATQAVRQQCEGHACGKIVLTV
ncbi:NAD(P)-dependent alcohol dehydrogenase [Nannocystaceae bacterium ST9]